MNAKKCDACGKLYEHYGKKLGEYNTLVLYLANIRGLEQDHKKYDLCPECMEKVMEILKHWPVKEGET